MYICVTIELNMKRQIDYSDIIDLGFEEVKANDSVYFNKYGYHYVIIEKELTNTIHVEWAKETMMCKIVRVDNPKTCNILAESPIYGLKHLKEIILFFTDKDLNVRDCSKIC